MTTAELHANHSLQQRSCLVITNVSTVLASVVTGVVVSLELRRHDRRAAARCS